MARQSRIWLGLAVVTISGLVAASAYFVLRNDNPIAKGRASDACPAKGPGGLVGFDLDTGQVRWTNVVRTDEYSTPIEPGRRGRVVVRSQNKPVSTVRAADGHVLSCRRAQSFDPEPGTAATGSTYGQFTFALADGWRYAGSGTAPGLNSITLTVTATRPDGSKAWTAPGRNLVGAVPGTVVTEMPEVYHGSGRVMPLEALDAATGAVRWRKEVVANDAVVTSSHVVAVDVGESSGRQKSVLRAYRLKDGSLDWSTDLTSATYPPSYLFVAGDTVYAPTDDSTRLVVIDPSKGRIRRAIDLPSPGVGGPWSKQGAVNGIVLDESTGTLVVAITAAQPEGD